MRRAVGLDGRVEVELYSETSAGPTNGEPGRLSAGAEFVIDGRTLTVERAATSRKGLFSVHFKGVADRDSADELRGVELELPESALPPLPDGVYYHYQLIGCSVVDLAGHRIGTLSGIMETGSNDVYLVADDDGRETLVPATKDTVKEVDTVGRVVTVDLPGRAERAELATPE